jgi:hypothetical protein
MVAHAFASRLEPRDVADAVIGGVQHIASRVTPRIAPCFAAAVAQPEDAGLHVGRIVDAVVTGLISLAMTTERSTL